MEVHVSVPAAALSTAPTPAPTACAAHPERSATRPCARCGNFTCEACLTGTGHCEACRRHPEVRAVTKEYAPCPGCGAMGAQRLTWTIWGGAFGPSLLTHVKCGACQTTYNGKTGRSNKRAIILYLLVTNVGGLALVYALFW
jgi:hypothetical protein